MTSIAVSRRRQTKQHIQIGESDADSRSSCYANRTMVGGRRRPVEVGCLYGAPSTHRPPAQPSIWPPVASVGVDLLAHMYGSRTPSARSPHIPLACPRTYEVPVPSFVPDIQTASSLFWLFGWEGAQLVNRSGSSSLHTQLASSAMSLSPILGTNGAQTDSANSLKS